MKGKISSFGGVNDTLVSPTEGLAIYEPSQIKSWWHRRIFLSKQPPSTSGLARRLDDATFYCAMRWNYQETSKEQLRDRTLVAISFAGKTVYAQPCDWGPNANTGRLIDASPAVLSALGCETDDEVDVEIVTLPVSTATKPPEKNGSVIISIGHHPKDKGATGGGLNEFDFNSPVGDRVVELLRDKGVDALKTSRPNPQWTADDINSHINSVNPVLAVELHANAYNGSASGTEMLYWHSSRNGKRLAQLLQDQVSDVLGLPDRGIKPKTRGDRGALFLSATNCPAVIAEPFFIDNLGDREVALEKKEQLAVAYAKAILAFLAT